MSGELFNKIEIKQFQRLQLNPQLLQSMAVLCMGNAELVSRSLAGIRKNGLVKRLESSFYAFKCSLKRFEKSYMDFIKMYQSGTVYIGKKDISKYIIINLIYASQFPSKDKATNKSREFCSCFEV